MDQSPQNQEGFDREGEKEDRSKMEASEVRFHELVKEDRRTRFIVHTDRNWFCVYVEY